MKYAFSLMALLVCALLFTGCDRSQLTAEKPDDEQEVSLELSTEQPQEDTTHSPDETLTLLRPDDETEAETTEPSSEENTEKQPSDKDETPADETEPATEQTVETPTTSAPIVGSETLPFSSELILVCDQTVQTYGTSCMEFPCAYTHLCSEAVSESVGILYQLQITEPYVLHLLHVPYQSFISSSISLSISFSIS